jgi:hypothetical protein
MNFEERLREELHEASGALPAVGPDLDKTIDRGRRLRRRTLLVTGAAAIVVGAAVVGGVALLSGDKTTAPLPPADTPTEQASPPDTTPTLDQVEPVLRAWLSAIQAGDEDGAWALMTSEAQAEVGREAFDEMMASALPEGLGAFADATDVSHVVVSMDGGIFDVVAVVSGDVTREGTTEFDAMAIPMQVRDGETLVNDPFIGRDRYYDRVAIFASVSAGPFSFHAGDELIVEFGDSEDATDVFIAVDEDDRPLPSSFDLASGRAAGTLDRDLEKGPHVATVIVVHRSGRLYPEAIPFEAAAP